MRKSERISCLVLCMIFSAFFFTQISLAGLSVHAHDSLGNLYTVDVETTVAEWIGNTGQVFTDIAFDSEGRLFGISNQSRYLTKMALFEIDPEDASVVKIGDLGTGGFVNALVFDENGTLWAAGDEYIITIDPSTGAGTIFSDAVSGYGSAGDLALDEFLNMFLTTDTGMLIQIDRSNGSVSEVGMIPQNNMYGFAAGNDGQMYGLSSDNQIFLINPVTGTGTSLGSISASFTLGKTNGTSFIPEPATLFLLAAGAILTGINSRP